MNLRTTLGIILLLFVARPSSAQERALKISPLDPKRVTEISLMLSENPKGLGDPIENRRNWDRLFQSGQFSSFLKEADIIAANPFPELTDSIYFEYYKGKDSQTSKLLIMKRRTLLAKLVWAECLTNKGKYMPAIRNAFTNILNTPSWTFPAEDRGKTNYLGKLYTINLSSSAYGWNMAQTLYLLRSKLSTRMQQDIMDALYKKVFNPTLAAISNNNANGEFISLEDTGNHNSVTLAGVTGAALTVISDKKERAVFAAIAERYSNNFLKGYLDDGYCTEGLGYYIYGFGHYLVLAEELLQATNGKLDIKQRPKIDQIAKYAPGMEIINGVYAAIADCEPHIKPDQSVMYYINKSFGLGLKQYQALPKGNNFQLSPGSFMYYFPNSSDLVKMVVKEPIPQIRHYFEQAGVLTVRPLPGTDMDMGATLKGGNNAEHHNHNDVGSFSIVVGNEMLVGDPGLAIYTPKYFTKERYALFKTTNSYAHPVPLVAGVQQFAGSKARAEVRETNFTEKKDQFTLDLTSAYMVPALQSLVRNFTYDRSGKGSLTVADSVSFTSPQQFETALITRANWKQVSANIIEFKGKDQKMRATISVPGSGFKITSEEITEAAEPYTRLGILLNDPIVSGTITLRFTQL